MLPAASVPSSTGGDDDEIILTIKTREKRKAPENSLYIGTDDYYKNDKEMTEDQIKMIRNQLTTALDSKKSTNGKKCSDFLKETLRNLGTRYKDILEIYDLYAQKKAIYDAPISDGEAPYPAASKKARLRIGLAASKQLIEKGIEKPDFVVLTVFHELIHGAGKTRSFSHEAMAKAMYAAARNLEIIPEGALPKADPKKLSSKNQNVVSDELYRIEGEWFKITEEALIAACGGSKGWELK